MKRGPGQEPVRATHKGPILISFGNRRVLSDCNPLYQCSTLYEHMLVELQAGSCNNIRDIFQTSLWSENPKDLITKGTKWSTNPILSALLLCLFMSLYQLMFLLWGTLTTDTWDFVSPGPPQSTKLPIAGSSLRIWATWTRHQDHIATYNQHIKNTDMSLTFYTASNAVSPLMDASCEITEIQNRTSICAMILADFK